MFELYKLEDLVRFILTTDEKTRNNDMTLYYEYVRYMTTGEDVRDNFWRIFADKEYRKSKGIKEYDSVGRCRRKIQANDPTLKPNKVVQELKGNREKEFIEYAIN